MHESFERELRLAGPKAEYDEHAKRILAHKIVLAHILIHAVPEFLGLEPEYVVTLIEGEPEVASVPVYPGETNKTEKASGAGDMPVITGNNTENKISEEGTVTFDVKFFAWAPNRQEKIKIIVDAEAQRQFNPGYDIVTRAVFYTARMLSAQLDVEFKADNYNDIKKVYSIWICMNTPARIENTITSLYIDKMAVCGPPIDIGRYDLLGVIIVGLPKRLAGETDELRLHRLLGTIFSSELAVETKKKILATEYDIVMSNEMERRTEEMCNLSEAIEERGIEKGREKGREEGLQEGRQEGRQEGLYKTLCSLLDKNIITVNQAAEQAGVTEQEFWEKIKELKMGK